MIWLVMAILFSVCFLQTMRWTQQARGSVILVGLVNYLLAATFFGVEAIVRPPVATGRVVVILGICTGALYVNNYYLISAVIRRIGVGLATATMTLAVTLPVAVSIAYGEPWLDKSAGLIVAMIALPLVALGGADLAGPSKPVSGIVRVFWVVLIYLAVGAENTFFKIAERQGGPGFEALFLPALFLTAAVVAMPPALLARPKVRPADVVRGGLLGSCNVLSNYCLAQAMQRLDGPLLFPVKLNGIVLLSAFLGWLLWQERLSRMALAGIALTLLSTCLLGWPDLAAVLGN